MNKKLIALAVATGLAAPMAAQAEVESKWFGFSQITMEQRDDKAPNDGIAIGADRVRIGYKLRDDNVFAKLQLDFNRSNLSDAKVGTLPEIIKDAEVGYKFGNHKIKAGVFKTPLGMDFNTSGKKLDITKRGLEKGLVLERTAGVMLSGNKLGGGFGYDIFFGNPSGRSSAVISDTSGATGGQTGLDNTTVVRVRYDIDNIHLEASTGTSESSVAGEVDYEVTDVAASWKSGPATVKFEYIDGSGVNNASGRDESVWFLHGGYMLNKSTELVARHYSAERDDNNRDLTNTYIGATFWLGSSKTNGRLQLNYVSVGGDDASSANPYNGAGSKYTDDAILAQYQASF